MRDANEPYYCIMIDDRLFFWFPTHPQRERELSSRSLSRSYVTVWGWARAPRENRRPSLTNLRLSLRCCVYRKSQFASRTSPFEDYRTLRQYFHTRVHIHSCFTFILTDFFWLICFFFFGTTKTQQANMTLRHITHRAGVHPWICELAYRASQSALSDGSEVPRKTSSLKEDNGPRT